MGFNPSIHPRRHFAAIALHQGTPLPASCIRARLLACPELVEGCRKASKMNRALQAAEEPNRNRHKRQGTTSVVPQRPQNESGFNP
jgi:hypothetical protein